MFQNHFSRYFYFSIILFLFACNNKKKDSFTTELLGQYLFFDTNLSLNNTKSCASCHNPTFAFTDGYRLSVTSLGESTLHNAPSLINVSSLKAFDWGNPNVKNLETQMLRPLFAKNPVELGTHLKINELRRYFKNAEPYKTLISNEFGNIDTLKIEKIITKSIAAYLKILNSNNSKFDKFKAGKAKLNSSEKRGMELFFSSRLGCSNCHSLPNFTLSDKNGPNIYFNTGLYNIKNENLYPANDLGISKYTQIASDNGKFKVPSLRNVSLTAPYMHDGSVADLSEVIDIYAAGGRNISKGINIGDGRKNNLKSKLISGFAMTKEEKKDILIFLQTLTDSTIFINSKFQNPFRN